MKQPLGLYRYGPESSAMFNLKIRERAPIHLKDGGVVYRDIYTHYVSNNSPVYCRYMNKVYQVNAHNYRKENEYFTLSNYTMG